MKSTFGDFLKEKRILVIGGGFGGMRAALDLARMKIPGATITLVSDKHHFEYTPALYKLATGRSPLETCIPLAEIFRNTGVRLIVDTITGGSTSEKLLIGKSGSQYRYDFAILALGSETAYFNVPGIEEYSFAFKSVESALKLKRHLHSLFDNHQGLSKGDLITQFQFVIVGGGPAGVELAGEIRRYARELADKHDVPEKFVTVDIIQSAPRLLPVMPEKVSEIVMKRLSKLGINVILGKPVVSEDKGGVCLKDIRFNANTIVWTAGVKASHIYQKIDGLSLDKVGKVLVDEDLRAQGTTHTFVTGDGASTPFAGTAQTALYDGRYAARVIANTLRNKKLPAYKPRKTPYVVPVGPGWAVFTYKNISLSGKIFWWLRELIDFRFFLSILPLHKAYTVWSEGGVLCESCPTCMVAEESSHTIAERFFKKMHSH